MSIVVEELQGFPIHCSLITSSCSTLVRAVLAFGTTATNLRAYCHLFSRPTSGAATSM